MNRMPGRSIPTERLRIGYGSLEVSGGSDRHPKWFSVQKKTGVLALLFIAITAVSIHRSQQFHVFARHDGTLFEEQFLGSAEKNSELPANSVPAAFLTADDVIVPTVETMTFLTDAVEFVNEARVTCNFNNGAQLPLVRLDTLRLLPSPAMTALQQPFATTASADLPQPAPEVSAVVFSPSADSGLYVLSKQGREFAVHKTEAQKEDFFEQLGDAINPCEMEFSEMQDNDSPAMKAGAVLLRQINRICNLSFSSFALLEATSNADGTGRLNLTLEIGGNALPSILMLRIGRDPGENVYVVEEASKDVLTPKCSHLQALQQDDILTETTQSSGVAMQQPNSFSQQQSTADFYRAKVSALKPMLQSVSAMHRSNTSSEKLLDAIAAKDSEVAELRLELQRAHAALEQTNVRKPKQQPPVGVATAEQKRPLNKSKTHEVVPLFGSALFQERHHLQQAIAAKHSAYQHLARTNHTGKALKAKFKGQIQALKDELHSLTPRKMVRQTMQAVDSGTSTGRGTTTTHSVTKRTAKMHRELVDSDTELDGVSARRSLTSVATQKEIISSILEEYKRAPAGSKDRDDLRNKLQKAKEALPTLPKLPKLIDAAKRPAFQMATTVPAQQALIVDLRSKFRLAKIGSTERDQLAADLQKATEYLPMLLDAAKTGRPVPKPPALTLGAKEKTSLQAVSASATKAHVPPLQTPVQAQQALIESMRRQFKSSKPGSSERKQLDASLKEAEKHLSELMDAAKRPALQMATTVPAQQALIVDLRSKFRLAKIGSTERDQLAADLQKATEHLQTLLTRDGHIIRKPIVTVGATAGSPQQLKTTNEQETAGSNSSTVAVQGKYAAVYEHPVATVDQLIAENNASQLFDGEDMPTIPSDTDQKLGSIPISLNDDNSTATLGFEQSDASSTVKGTDTVLQTSGGDSAESAEPSDTDYAASDDSTESISEYNGSHSLPSVASSASKAAATEELGAGQRYASSNDDSIADENNATEIFDKLDLESVVDSNGFSQPSVITNGFSQPSVITNVALEADDDGLGALSVPSKDSARSDGAKQASAEVADSNVGSVWKQAIQDYYAGQITKTHQQPEPNAAVHKAKEDLKLVISDYQNQGANNTMKAYLKAKANTLQMIIKHGPADVSHSPSADGESQSATMSLDSFRKQHLRDTESNINAAKEHMLLAATSAKREKKMKTLKEQMLAARKSHNAMGNFTPSATMRVNVAQQTASAVPATAPQHAELTALESNDSHQQPQSHNVALEGGFRIRRYKKLEMKSDRIKRQSTFVDRRSNAANKLQQSSHEQTSAPLPPSFDWRVASRKCVGSSRIKDQGSCGSGWALAVLTAVESQTCLETGATLNLAVQQILDCIDNDKISGTRACQGGTVREAWNYVVSARMASLPGHNETDHPHVATDSRSCPNLKPVHCPTHIRVSNSQQAIMQAIKEHGPVTAVIEADDAFFSYNGGIYERRGPHVGAHAVNIVGWGSDEHGTPYWIGQNNFGSSWGEGIDLETSSLHVCGSSDSDSNISESVVIGQNCGFFRIKRGSNEAGIEEDVTMGVGYGSPCSADADAITMSYVRYLQTLRLHNVSEFGMVDRSGLCGYIFHPRVPLASTERIYIHLVDVVNSTIEYRSSDRGYVALPPATYRMTWRVENASSVREGGPSIVQVDCVGGLEAVYMSTTNETENSLIFTDDIGFQEGWEQRLNTYCTQRLNIPQPLHNLSTAIAACTSYGDDCSAVVDRSCDGDNYTLCYGTGSLKKSIYGHCVHTRQASVPTSLTPPFSAVLSTASSSTIETSTQATPRPTNASTGPNDAPAKAEISMALEPISASRESIQLPFEEDDAVMEQASVWVLIPQTFCTDRLNTPTPLQGYRDALRACLTTYAPDCSAVVDRGCDGANYTLCYGVDSLQPSRKGHCVYAPPGSRVLTNYVANQSSSASSDTNSSQSAAPVPAVTVPSAPGAGNALETSEDHRFVEESSSQTAVPTNFTLSMQSFHVPTTSPLVSPGTEVPVDTILGDHSIALSPSNDSLPSTSDISLPVARPWTKSLNTFCSARLETVSPLPTFEAAVAACKAMAPDCSAVVDRGCDGVNYTLCYDASNLHPSAHGHCVHTPSVSEQPIANRTETEPNHFELPAQPAPPTSQNSAAHRAEGQVDLAEIVAQQSRRAKMAAVDDSCYDVNCNNDKGKCIVNAMTGTPECECTEALGWTGEHCEIPPTDYSMRNIVCENSCFPGTEHDGYCEDGAFLNQPPNPHPDRKLKDSQYTYSGCALGTDCYDCGPRQVHLGIVEVKSGFELCAIMNHGDVELPLRLFVVKEHSNEVHKLDVSLAPRFSWNIAEKSWSKGKTWSCHVKCLEDAPNGANCPRDNDGELLE